MPGIHDSPRNFSGAVRTSVALRDRTLPAYPFRPSRLRRSSLIHTPCGSATEKNSSYSDATHTQEGPSGSCRRPRFFGRNRSLHVPCSRIIPNMPTRANRNRNPTNRPTAKEKGPTVFDRQAFPSVGVTGFEPATTRPPDVYSNRTELRPEYGCKGTNFLKKCNRVLPFFHFFQENPMCLSVSV